jgi:hypothetical protein
MWRFGPDSNQQPQRYRSPAVDLATGVWVLNFEQNVERDSRPASRLLGYPDMYRGEDSNLHYGRCSEPHAECQLVLNPLV